MSLRTPPILLADRIGIFYFRFLLFWRKVSNATTNMPVATFKDATAKIVETISYVVITPPPFLCIPVSWFNRLGRLPPCHGASHIVIIAYVEHTFNQFQQLFVDINICNEGAEIFCPFPSISLHILESIPKLLSYQIQVENTKHQPD